MIILTKDNEKQYLIGDILVHREHDNVKCIIVADGQFYNLINLYNWTTVYEMSVTICHIRDTFRPTNTKIIME